jgi:hypothetical protein
MDDLFYANGINLETGGYDVPPMSLSELDALLRKEQQPENSRQLKNRAERPASLGVKEGVEPGRLDQAGWGVIFADNAAPAVERALQPLLRLRESQAGKRFRTYSGTKGYRVGKDSATDFLARNGAGPGPADPDKVPYYLLIVGDPAVIPYSFQSQLDVQYAVGRLHFDRVADYAAYAESVVSAETGQVKLRREAAFFGVGHQQPDPATRQSNAYLIDPLVKGLGDTGWELRPPVLDAAATKAALAQHLGGSRTPALLFTAGHGLVVPAENQRKLPQTEYQGALICADWPGPGTPFADREFFFAGKDLAADANLLGLVGFFFACFGGGTPELDAFSRLQRMRKGLAPGAAASLTPRPFVADLPRRMLCAPGGGALAVIAHVERAWPSSFLWLRQEDGTLPAQTAAFESTLRLLMRGQPVGAALEPLNQRYAELAAMLLPYLANIEFGDPYDAVALANTWMAAYDAQWYTVIGDPAVRLPVVDAPAATGRAAPALTPVRINGAGGEDKETARATLGLETGKQGAILTAPPVVPQPPSPPAPQPPTAKGQVMKSARDTEHLFDESYSPQPAADQNLADLKLHHPGLYEAYVEHVREGYINNARIFESVRRAFMRSHYSTVAMYWLLFFIGAGTVITGIVLAVTGSSVVTTALFLGVGALAFIGYFIGRSVLSVEENLIYITWLGVIYNSYWTHLAWSTDPKKAQAELDKATKDAITQLERLINRHAKSARLRPNLRDGEDGQPDSQP